MNKTGILVRVFLPCRLGVVGKEIHHLMLTDLLSVASKPEIRKNQSAIAGTQDYSEAE
jgi:hypothetical protein